VSTDRAKNRKRGRKEGIPFLVPKRGGGKDTGGKKGQSYMSAPLSPQKRGGGNLLEGDLPFNGGIKRGARLSLWEKTR